MRRRALALAVAVLLAIGLLALGAPGIAAAHDRVTVLAADLKGANEVPPADPDGRGVALVAAGRTRVCFALAWTAIGPPIAAHIHQGPAGVNGPVVVPFLAAPNGLPDTLRAVGGCIPDVDPALARDIRRHPDQYYVNIHTAEVPGGAIRGQLRRVR